MAAFAFINGVVIGLFALLIAVAIGASEEDSTSQRIAISLSAALFAASLSLFAVAVWM